MVPRLLYGALFLFVFGTGSCQRSRFPGRGNDTGSILTVDPASVSSIADRASIRKTQGGLVPPRVPLTGIAPPLPESELRQIVTEVNASISSLETKIKNRPISRPGSFPFGPHLLTTDTAREIGNIGRSFVETAKRVRERRPLSGGVIKPNTETESVLPCPYEKPIKCDRTAIYRTITGACNNLENPYWGKSNTPFERSAPSAYEDGLDSPRSRSVLNRPLPLPREISTIVNEASDVRHLDTRFTHVTMTFGQFVSHNTERFAAVSNPDGSELECCDDESSDAEKFGCFPIKIPKNDPFFSQYNRRCMEMVRASSTPNLGCELGVREQLNQETAYVDGSGIYGSTEKLSRQLRQFRGGLLKAGKGPDGDLLLQDEELKNPECQSQRRRACFRAGDARVNQQPALMSMHTLWLREHNRVARALSKINRNWNDEKLFQEARKIVSAELQHVVYHEFLQVLVGPVVARYFDFPAKRSGYNSDYNSDINPQIRSAFSAAAYRVGHSLVQTFLAQSEKVVFKDHFLRPDILYERNRGTSFVIKNLFTDKAQKCDRLITPHLTNTLFEQDPGTGIDLAATNIQRGRDFGIPSYNVYRVLCGFSRATHFGTGRGGLVDHNREAALLLQKAYKHVDDIDLWVGGVSEKVLRGGVIGPTLACVIGRQFFLLKKGDRFFYENNDKYAKLPLNQLDEIRKTSLSRIICDNTQSSSVQPNAFRYPSRFSNPTTNCRDIPKVDLSLWAVSSCTDGGWSAWTKHTSCIFGFTFQFRICDSPSTSPCGKYCEGPSFRWKRCGRGRSGSTDPLKVARRVAPRGVII